MERAQWTLLSADIDNDELVGDRIDVTLALGAAVFVITGVAQLAFDSAERVWIPSVVALVTAALLGAGALVLRSSVRDRILRSGDGWAVGTASLIAANPLAYMVATTNTYPAIGAVLVIVAVAALVPSLLFAATLIVTINIAWLCVASVYPPEVPYPTLLLQVSKADAVAAIVAITWTRTRRRLNAANDLIRQMAVLDDLTGLPNRRGLRPDPVCARTGCSHRRGCGIH